MAHYEPQCKQLICSTDFLALYNLLPIMICRTLVNTGNRNNKLKTGSTGLSVDVLPVLINSLATSDIKAFITLIDFHQQQKLVQLHDTLSL